MTARPSAPARSGVFLTDGPALAEGLRLGRAGVWRWKIDSNELEWTAHLAQVHALPPEAFDGTLASFQNDLHPEDSAAVWQQILATLDTGAPYRCLYRTAPRAGQPDLWIEASGGISHAPDGTRYLTGICTEVSARVRGEQQLARRLAQHHAVARFGSYALAEPDFQKVLDRAVEIAADVLAVPLTKILQFADTADHLVLVAGLGWKDGLVGTGKVGIERESQAGFTLLSSEPVLVEDLQHETRFDGPQILHDHGVRSGVSVTIPGSGLRPFGVFGIHAREVRRFEAADAEFLLSLANIVAGAARQVEAARHQAVLMREMAHRAGNMLQLINSIAGQTFNASADPRAARHSFSERLGALARSNYIVSRGGWAPTRFAELVAEVLQPYGARITTSGRDILLHPDLCFDMGLVLHELASHARQHGGLAKVDGSVSLHWTFRADPGGPRVFCLDWRDAAGDAAGDGPAGFGAKLVRALVEQKWQGQILQGAPPGFGLRLEIPHPDRP